VYWLCARLEAYLELTVTVHVARCASAVLALGRSAGYMDHISCGGLVIEFSREHVTGHLAEVLEPVNRAHDDRRAAVASREPRRACLSAR
jgi:hypothetical protein